MTSPGVCYRGLVKRRLVWLSAAGVLLLAALLVDVARGPSAFAWQDVLRGLLAHASLTPAQNVILWDIRLPQALLAVLVGAALGLAGAQLQTVLNNPLASPCSLGLTSAATVGAALAIIGGWHVGGLGQHVMIPLLAFLCTLGAAWLILVLARLFGARPEMVVLFGIALFFLCNALVALLQYLAAADALQQVVFWTMGSVTRATWIKNGILAAAVLVLLSWIMRDAWRLTALRAGEEHAASLGIATERLRLVCLVRASILAALAVSFAGAIAFIGLVGPHLARLVFGEDHRFYLPGSAVAGALVLSLAAIASKALVPGAVLPIGIVTALAGIPLLVVLLFVQRRRS